jgi:hypothetical protein
MTPIEIVEIIKGENPWLLGGMPGNKAAQLIREALNQLGKHIDAQAEGVVKVPGFGNFRIGFVEREKDGQKATVKRIMLFRPVKPENSPKS